MLRAFLLCQGQTTFGYKTDIWNAATLEYCSTKEIRVCNKALKKMINDAYGYTIRMETLKSNIRGEVVEPAEDEEMENSEEEERNQTAIQSVCHICKKKIEEQGKTREDIEKELEKLNQMKKDESYIKEVEKTIKAKWSEQAYNGTNLKRGNLFMDDTVKNTLIIKARSEEKSVLLDVAKSKYSDLDILLGEKDERVQFLESMTRTSKTTETNRSSQGTIIYEKQLVHLENSQRKIYYNILLQNEN
ncbi:hypothetical protein WDU94_002756 [Cyamophila willieti]